MGEKHMPTPGPWRHMGVYVFGGSGDQTVILGRAAYADVSFREAEANARLIAAAPDLYEALKEMRNACAAAMRVIATDALAVTEWEAELRRIGVTDGFGVRANAALAKAEGQ